MTLLLCLGSATLLAPLGLSFTSTDVEEPAVDAPAQWGHSAHGASYDQGPRQRPWVMEGIGSTPFPITSADPEVQRWFDQGIALLHGFWHFEAERSFRWCLKLDPECAMAYWGMALATRRDDDRRREFLDEALARRTSVSEREQAFIDVSDAFLVADEANEDEEDEAEARAMSALDRLLMDYPGDVEAKALYWLLSVQAFGSQQELARYAHEAVLDDILEVAPDHVGALHYRVHNWDGKEGGYVVDSCLKLGEIAPGCGHLLHMPGHVLSGIGLWHEAAIAMDRATRVEKDYMNRRMILPEDNWDYPHNLDYLCYIQEQLGLVDQALLGAEQLLKSPGFVEGKFFETMLRSPTVRALVKFERWDEILEEGRIRWGDSPMDRMEEDSAKFRALIGLGRVAEAEEVFERLKEGDSAYAPKSGGPGGAPGDGKRADDRPAGMRAWQERRVRELEGMLLIAQGESLEGLSVLTEAAADQAENWQNDPPRAANYLYNVLGDHYLELGAPRLAIDCYERTLETVFHDGFALAGLVVAHAQLGQTEQAEAAMAKLGVVWSDAQPNRWLTAAQATGITAEPHLEAEIEQRNYVREVLEPLGPSLWTPSELPDLVAINADGDEVSLEDYRGQNVVLIFYLGDECVHCIEQLQLAEERLDALTDLDTVVLAVSKDLTEEIAEQQPDFGLTLLSDVEFESAHRFHSYDDFEEIELHSTFLIDRDGRMHWSRIGGEPFTDFDYLENELKRMNRNASVTVAEAPEAPGSTEAKPSERARPAGAGSR